MAVNAHPARPTSPGVPAVRDGISVEVSGLLWNGRGEAICSVPAVRVRVQVR